MRRAVSFLAFFLLLAWTCSCRPSRPVTELNISAAASLRDVLLETEQTYSHLHPGTAFRNNFGGSGALAQQILNGAPADIFLSASSQQMDMVERRSQLQPGTRVNLLRNQLVLVAPRNSSLDGLARLTSPQVRTIAIGDPALVPAGLYAEQALKALGLDTQLRKRLVYANDVRQVLAYVETGNADAGFVYATDALASKRVRIVATLPEETHDPVLYPAAILRNAPHSQQARPFLHFLCSPEARALFQARGFTIATP